MINTSVSSVLRSNSQHWYSRSVMESRELLENPSIVMYLPSSHILSAKRKILGKKIDLIEKSADAKLREERINRLRPYSKKRRKEIKTSSIASSSTNEGVLQSSSSSLISPKRALSPSPASSPFSLFPANGPDDDLKAFVDTLNTHQKRYDYKDWRAQIIELIVQLEQTKNVKRIREGLFSLLRLGKFETKWVIKWMILDKLRSHFTLSIQVGERAYLDEFNEYKRALTRVEILIQETIISKDSLEFISHLIAVYRDILAQIWVLSLWMNRPVDETFVQNIESKLNVWDEKFSDTGDSFIDNLIEDALHSLEMVVEKFLLPFPVDKIKEAGGQSFLPFAISILEDIGDDRLLIRFYQNSLKEQNLDERTRLSTFHALSKLSLEYDAIGYLNEALNITSRNGQHEDSILILLDLYRINHSMKKTRSAQGYLRKALQLAKSRGLKKQQANIFGLLGDFFLTNGGYPRARRYFEEGLAIGRRSKDPTILLLNVLGLGAYFFKCSEYPQAKIHFEEALSIINTLEDVIVGQRIYLSKMLAETYHRLGRYDERDRFLGGVLRLIVDETDIEDKIRNECLLTLAQFCTDFHLERAVKIFSDLLADGLAEDDFKASVYNGLALAYARQGQFQLAIDNAENSLRIGRNIHDTAIHAQALDCLGFSYERSGNMIEAENCYRKSIEIYSILESQLVDQSLSKIILSREYSGVYLRLEKLLFDSGRIEEALSVADAGRARTLRYLLNKKLPLDNRSAIEQMSTQDIQSLAARLETTFVFFSFPQIQVSIDLKDISNDRMVETTIPPDGVTESYARVWVISPNSFNATTIDLQGVIGTIPNLGWWEKHVFSLLDMTVLYKKWYEVLIQPIETFLPQNQGARLSLIVNGEISKLPFPALQDASEKYLIENYALSFAPSIRALELMHKLDQNASKSRYRMNRKALIIGDPQLEESVKPLYCSRTDAETILRLTEGISLFGQQALRRDVIEEMQQASLLHFSCHGKGSGEKKYPHSIYEGCLYLSNGESSDPLYAEDVARMHLNAEIAYLCACETGQGHLTQEGTIGFIHAFLSSGIPTVIATSFEVQNIPASIIAQTFYHRFLGRTFSGLRAVKSPYPKMDKDYALREAMLKAIRKNRDPKFWAFFFLVGLPTGEFRTPLRICSRL